MTKSTCIENGRATIGRTTISRTTIGRRQLSQRQLGATTISRNVELIECLTDIWMRVGSADVDVSESVDANVYVRVRARVVKIL